MFAGSDGGADRWAIVASLLTTAKLNDAPVGSFPANAFGLFDMHGNAAEWVQDCYYPTYFTRTTSGAAVPAGATSCGVYYLRGGSASATAQNARSASRQQLAREIQLAANLGNPAMSNVGFRVARSLP